MQGYSRITARCFYALGGFSNRSLVRVMRARQWVYYRQP